MTVSISMFPGRVFSSRYAERVSPFIILVPFMARIMSPPIGMVVPKIVAFCVAGLNPAAAAGLLLRTLVISHPYVMFMSMAFAM